MNSRGLQIVAFDVPYPPNYGGVIDVFYKIKSLAEAGFEITLHCFDYGRGQQPELEKYCRKIHFYKRQSLLFSFFSLKPLIATSRANQLLLERLKSSNQTILFEGLHACFFLNHPDLECSYKIVRTHNIEHDYYFHLYKSESNWFKKIFFFIESKKLERFEHVLTHANVIAAISQKDAAYLSKTYKSVYHISAFHPYSAVSSLPGCGDYVLYHGNLAIAENNSAALFLVNEVFSKLHVPFIIAGSNPTTELIQTVAKYQNITLKANISTEAIDELIQHAHINILPTFQATGIKLKLLAALFLGRHCLVNQPMVQETGLEALCHVGNTAENMVEMVQALITKEFGLEEIIRRKKILELAFSNQSQLKTFAELLDKSK